MLLSVSLLLPGQAALRAGPAGVVDMTVLRLPSGLRFGLIGGHPAQPAPTLFVFQGDLEVARREPIYTEVARIVGRHGFISVTLDAPAHGEDHRPGEPAELAAWCSRVNHGEDFIGEFTANASAVLDYLVREGYTDPTRVAACGTSRGAFLAFHLAAADPRIRCVGGIGALVDLTALREFQACDHKAQAESLSLTALAPRLAGRGAWVSIGNNDSRVGTDKAIAFTRALVAATAAQRKGGAPVPIPVELIVNSTAGHQSTIHDHELLAAWLLRQFGMEPLAVAAAPADEAPGDLAFRNLTDVLANDPAFPRIHAAEDLLHLGRVTELPVIERELATRGDEPIYRIGLWRAMARQARTAAGREAWIQKLKNVALGPDTRDRLHAMESLAKLGWIAQGSDRAECMKIAQSGPTPLALHARWVLANGGAPEDEALLARALGSPDDLVRGDAAYAFRFLPRVRPETRNLLSEAAQKEQPGSSCRVYLVAAAVAHCLPEERPPFLDSIRAYARDGNPDEAVEALAALARFGTPADMPIAEKRMKQFGFSEVRGNEASVDMGVAASDAFLEMERRSRAP